MMYKSFVSLVLALKTLSSFGAETANSVFAPHRVTHDDLISHSTDTLLIEALTQDGIVSITNIPDFRELKRNLLSHLHSCLLDMEEDENTFKSEYADGTIRRTMASVTIPGPGGARPFEYDGESANCQEFASGLKVFRKIVDSTTDEFAERVSLEMGSSLETPLMNTKDGEYSFDNFEDVVREGEHLEHFHSYQKLSSPEDASENTIELHTDQGLFITFTPALVVTHDTSQGAPDLSVPLKESQGFYIETADGNTALVDLTSEDDLVFMFGDGVNQYVNPMLRKDSNSLSKTLRATPHAVKLDAHDSSLARVWFGLMVLPPSSAYNENEDKTYGEIRNLLTTLDEDEIPSGLGCSSTQMRALEGGDGCFEEGAIQCWHRCMPLETYDLTFESCTAENHAIKCVNPRGQVSTGEQHGDFYPECTDSVAVVTDYPKIPEWPQDAELCTDEAWEKFNEGDYQYTFNLTTDRTDANFYWTPNMEAETIKGRLVFNGQFGYLSFGFINLDPEARHKGMNGGHVIMATPGSAFTYSARTGLDLESDPMIAEFKINEEGSSFRHWYTPVGETTAQHTVHEDDCFTSLEFELDSIYESKFDVHGSNIMMWAGNPTDSFAGYHSRNRAIFTVEWETGLVQFGKELTPSIEDGTESVDVTATTGTESSGSGPLLHTHLSAILIAIFGLVYSFTMV